MALIDSVTITATAGKGGDGVVRWLHEKGKPRGGPAGGDGGRGGDVLLEGVRDLAALASFRYEKEFRAENGQSGGNNNRRGAVGKPVVLRVPVGTLVRVPAFGREIEIMHEGETHVLFTGGEGGFGNAHFKGPENQDPFQATSGKPGEAGEAVFELKLIADAGLIGLPSAGKSSLLNGLTRARAKVGAYPFTTLEPNLGDFYGYILADIPGLIEGAAQGRGLGARFLKHIERTRILIHLISAEQDNPQNAYREVRREVEAFGQGLPDKPEIVVLSKADIVSAEERISLKKEMEEFLSQEVLVTSTQDPTILKTFSDTLAARLSSLCSTQGGGDTSTNSVVVS